MPHCVALPMVARCGIQESKAAVMNLASVLEGLGRASRMRKGMATGLVSVCLGGGIKDGNGLGKGSKVLRAG